MAQNIVLSHLEREIIVPLIKDEKIDKYYRWVDDLLIRSKSRDAEKILKKINGFDKKLKFTIERPKVKN